MVAALLGALRRSRSCRCACAFISAIAARFCSITGVMSTNDVGVKLQSSGWCGSKRRSSGGWNGPPNALAVPAPAASARARSTARNALAWSGLNGSRSVCVSEHVRRELADLVGERAQARPCRPRAGSRRGRGTRRSAPSAAAARSASPWRISFTRSTVCPAPSRARPTRPARRRRARARARCRRRASSPRSRRRRARRSRRECAPITSSRLLTSPASLRECVDDHRRGPRPRRSRASSSRSAQSASPSSTGG